MHNQADSPAHHGSGPTTPSKRGTEKNTLRDHEAKLKWVRCLINQPVTTNYSKEYPNTSKELRWARGFHNNPAIDREDGCATPDPSDSDESEKPEETRRLEP